MFILSKTIVKLIDEINLNIAVQKSVNSIFHLNYFKTNKDLLKQHRRYLAKKEHQDYDVENIK
jgi:hypothetical protein